MYLCGGQTIYKMKKILIMRFSALGDVAMLVPVVKELSVARPDLEITVLSQPFCEPLFEGLGANVAFMGADIKGEYHSVKALGRLFKVLDKMGFDYVADMHGVLRTHYLTMRFRLKGYKVAKIDKRRAERRALTAPEHKKVMRQLSTSFEKYRKVLVSLLGDQQGNSEESRVRGEEPEVGGRGEKQSQLNGNGMPTYDTTLNSSLLTPHSSLNLSPEGRKIGIAPFAAHAGKIYPLERMERVVEMLTERERDARIYLFGGGGKEREQMRQWAERWPESVTVAADVVKGLREELQLMARLDVMVSMDSANMHLASLVGTRVVSVWGATHPYAGFLGWGQKTGDCVQVALPCRPCSVFGNKPCRRGDFACMRTIEPERIVERIVK